MVYPVSSNYSTLLAVITTSMVVLENSCKNYFFIIFWLKRHCNRLVGSPLFQEETALFTKMSLRQDTDRFTNESRVINDLNLC